MADEQTTPDTTTQGGDAIQGIEPTTAESNADAVAPVGNAPAQVPTQDPQQLASDFKKDELVAAAAVQGVDVPKSATKADIAQAITDQGQGASSGANPVIVDNRTARSDDDARFGGWLDVVSGEYQGRFGSYVATVSTDAENYPERIIVRTRDADNLLIEVNYSDTRPSQSNGGR